MSKCKPNDKSFITIIDLTFFVAGIIEILGSSLILFLEIVSVIKIEKNI